MVDMKAEKLVHLKVVRKVSKKVEKLGPKSVALMVHRKAVPLVAQ